MKRNYLPAILIATLGTMAFVIVRDLLDDDHAAEASNTTAPESKTPSAPPKVVRLDYATLMEKYAVEQQHGNGGRLVILDPSFDPNDKKGRKGKARFQDLSEDVQKALAIFLHTEDGRSPWQISKVVPMAPRKISRVLRDAGAA